MGVIKDLVSIANQEFSDDASNQTDDIYFSETESVESIRVRLGNYRKLKKLNKNQPENFLTENFSRFGERSSKRRQRIIENNKYLIQLSQDLHDSSTGSLSIDDFVVDNFSAFTLLFSHVKNFQAWDQFINSSEEEQAKYLDVIDNTCKHVCLDSIQEENEDLDIYYIKEDIHNNKCCKCNRKYDSRKVYPASYTNAKQHFLKIDNYIKNLLNKNHLPIDKILNIEEDLRKYFTLYPESTYKTVLDNSYHRLLAHGICKYLDLNSKSDSATQPRTTFVKNRHKIFKPPKMYLVEFLGKDLQTHNNTVKIN
ncbi:unnamed protein product [Gordionus sp. m RMFG-2023]|uniref:R3H domain-containing protein 4-like n=1 Tax=Gordionus sp. m RMFG-2023 TaxID=3053472 RepID=UPI0030E4FFC6